ncbi:MAG TPA: hypothetical protein O0X97_01300 [Methanocorpusculum sp.]|nr:hypothetical protein [Methanocorpusculum sp.]
MTQYLFGEEILREDRRVGSYFVRYLPWLIISAVLAVAPWILPLHYAWVASVFNYVMRVIPDYLYARIAVSVLFGIIFVILLIACLRNLKNPRLVITKNRICCMKRPNHYREARFDKIDALKVRGKTFAVYAGGRKVFAFGPISEPYTTREALVVLVEKRYEDDSSSAQTKPLSCSEAEPVSKSGDVFTH